MSDAFAHCEQLVRTADADRFLATLFAPPERRGPLYALYAFDIEIARVPTFARQSIAGEIRLQWWREVLEGQRNDEAFANPVASALIETLEKSGLSRASLIDSIEARTFDLYTDPFATIRELEAYTQRTRGTLMICAAAILGCTDASLSLVTDHAAIAIAVAELLATFPARASLGHLHVPLEILDRHGVEPADVLAGRSSNGLLAALADMRALARDHFKGSKQLTPTVPGAAAPAFLPVALVPLYLDRMERPDYDPFQTAVAVPQWRRQWALWRTARRWDS